MEERDLGRSQQGLQPLDAPLAGVMHHSLGVGALVLAMGVAYLLQSMEPYVSAFVVMPVLL